MVVGEDVEVDVDVVVDVIVVVVVVLVRAEVEDDDNGNELEVDVAVVEDVWLLTVDAGRDVVAVEVIVRRTVEVVTSVEVRVGSVTEEERTAEEDRDGGVVAPARGSVEVELMDWLAVVSCPCVCPAWADQVEVIARLDASSKNNGTQTMMQTTSRSNNPLNALGIRP